MASSLCILDARLRWYITSPTASANTRCSDWEGGREGGREMKMRVATTQVTYREREGEVRSVAGAIFSHLLLSLIKHTLNLTDEALGAHRTSVQSLEINALIV